MALPRSQNENLTIKYSYRWWCKNLCARNSIHLNPTIGHTSKGVLACFFQKYFTLVWTLNKTWNMIIINNLLLKCEINRIWLKITSANKYKRIFIISELTVKNWPFVVSKHNPIFCFIFASVFNQFHIWIFDFSLRSFGFLLKSNDYCFAFVRAFWPIAIQSLAFVANWNSSQLRPSASSRAEPKHCTGSAPGRPKNTLVWPEK